MRKIVFIAASLLVFAVFNTAIYQKERIKANGETVLLELAPVDPRSLMQGDYMRLRYALERNHGSTPPERQTYMVVATDASRVAHFVRFDNGEPLATGEKRLHFRLNHGSVRIVPDSFMFQEGQAQRYQKAKYGVFKFDDAGNRILVGLADDKLQNIQPE